ncbi:MAG: protein-tyrosine phosphatase family protein [Gammaproteobacteria bacterium]
MRRPHDNTYWVEPGRLLAGEYPGAWNDQDTNTRLQGYLDCGVRDFLDLTFPDELRPYDHLLARLSEDMDVSTRYRRIPVRDMDVPHQLSTMKHILDHVDQAMKRGAIIYIHCWGGIGRTGTTVGCYLVRHGISGVDALHHLASLWPAMAKSDRYPTTPQTHEQMAYIRNWRE